MVILNQKWNSYNSKEKFSDQKKKKGTKERYATGQNFNPQKNQQNLQGETLKQTFGTMDFSTRNKLNHQIIQNLQNSSDVTMEDLSEQHVDRAESRKMMRDIFPPEDYGYQQLDSLEQAVKSGKYNKNMLRVTQF